MHDQYLEGWAISSIVIDTAVAGLGKEAVTAGTAAAMHGLLLINGVSGWECLWEREIPAACKQLRWPDLWENGKEGRRHR